MDEGALIESQRRTKRCSEEGAWLWQPHVCRKNMVDPNGSHGMDRSKYRKDLNRGLFLQSQECQMIYISLDEMKENPSFVLAMVRSILAPYLAAADEKLETVRRKFQKIERELMRLAIRNNRIICPPKGAKELEIHKQTVIKYCRSLVEKGKFRAIPTGTMGKIYKYEYIGSIQSPELL